MKKLTYLIRRPTVALFLVALAYFLVVGFHGLHSTGLGHLTLKYGDMFTQGCLCHGIGQPTRTVKVWVTGPESLKIGTTGEYYVSIIGGPAVGGGFNVDAGKGYVSPGDSTSYLWGGEDELTHIYTKLFVNDTVRWKFFYQAPLTNGLDTIFSVGNSVDYNLDPTNDEYNFGPNFLVKLVDTVVSVVETSTPAEFRLLQNYPNPFNPVTTISYQLKHESLVQLSVYNLEGQAIGTLVNATVAPGQHSVRFDGAGLPSGVYFCRLHITSENADIAPNAKDFYVSRKMVLLK